MNPDWADDGQMADYFAEQEALSALAEDRPQRPRGASRDDGVMSAAMVFVVACAVVVLAGIGLLMGAPAGGWLMVSVIGSAVVVLVFARTDLSKPSMPSRVLTLLRRNGMQSVEASDGRAKRPGPVEEIDRQIVAAYAVTSARKVSR